MTVTLFSYMRFATPTIARVIAHSPELSKEYKLGAQHAALAALDALQYTETMTGDVGFPALAQYASLFAAFNATETMARSFAVLEKVTTDYADGFVFTSQRITELLVAFGDETEPEAAEANA